MTGDAYDDLARRVAWLEASPALGLSPPPAAASPPLSEPPGADQSLVDWVTWLVSTHELAVRIPACWALHPGLVAELDALHRAHGAAVTSSGTGDRLAWYEGLGKMLGRVDQAPAGSCARRVHHQGSPKGP